MSRQSKDLENYLAAYTISPSISMHSQQQNQPHTVEFYETRKRKENKWKINMDVLRCLKISTNRWQYLLGGVVMKKMEKWKNGKMVNGIGDVDDDENDSK